MDDSGVSDCLTGPNSNHTRSRSLETEDLSFEGSHLQGERKSDLFFGEWNSFEESVQLDFSDHRSLFSASTPPERLQEEHCNGKSQQSSWAKRKAFEYSELQLTFHCCFPSAGDNSEEAPIRPLSHLLERAPEIPTSASSVLWYPDNAATLWKCLLVGSHSPKLSVPNPHPRSQEGLLSVLNITQPALRKQQDVLPAAFNPEEDDMEPLGPHNSTTLIQTKHQDSPGFLYQISYHWLSQHSLDLQGQASRKGFFL